MKAQVDKIDAVKMRTVPVDLSEPSTVVDYNVVKKTVNDKLVTIDIKVLSSRWLVTRQGGPLKKKIKDAGKKIPNTSVLVRKTNYNTKLYRYWSKWPIVIGLATTTLFDTKVMEIENKIPDITNLATTAALTTKLKELKIKYVTLLIQQMQKLLPIQKVKVLKIKYLLSTVSLLVLNLDQKKSFDLKIKEEAMNLASKNERKDVNSLDYKNQGKARTF